MCTVDAGLCSQHAATGMNYGTIIIMHFAPYLPSLPPLPSFLLQVPLIILQKMDLILKKTGAEDVKKLVLPMIVRSLEADHPQLQVGGV